MDQAPAAAPSNDGAPAGGGGLAARLGIIAHRAAPLVVLALFAVAIWAIHHELTAHSLRDLVAEIRRISPAWIALALGLTAAAYSRSWASAACAISGTAGRPRRW